MYPNLFIFIATLIFFVSEEYCIRTNNPAFFNDNVKRNILIFKNKMLA